MWRHIELSTTGYRGQVGVFNSESWSQVGACSRQEVEKEKEHAMFRTWLIVKVLLKGEGRQREYIRAKTSRVEDKLLRPGLRGELRVKPTVQVTSVSTMSRDCQA